MHIIQETFPNIRLPEPPYDAANPPSSRRLPHELINGTTYIGRNFNDTLTAVERREISNRDALEMFRQGDYGNLIFYGLSVEACKLIASEDTDGLASYFDSNVDKLDESSGALILHTADGVVRRTMRCAEPYANNVRQILEQRAKRGF